MFAGWRRAALGRMDGEVGVLARALEEARAAMEGEEARCPAPLHRPPALHLLVGRAFFAPAFFDDGSLFSFATERVRDVFYGGVGADGRADAGVDEDHATPDHHIDRCAAAALENVDAVFGHLSKLGHLRRSAPLFRPPAGIAPRVRVAVPVPDVTRPPTSAAFRFTP